MLFDVLSLALDLWPSLKASSATAVCFVETVVRSIYSSIVQNTFQLLQHHENHVISINRCFYYFRFKLYIFCVLIEGVSRSKFSAQLITIIGAA